MAAYQDQGIVLRGRVYRENDSLVTLFLMNQGKVAAVAKGARKPRSPFLAGLYPLSYTDFSLYRGRSALESVVGAEVIHSFGRIRENLDRIGWAALMADVVDECFSDHDPSPEAFYALVAGLEGLNDGHHAPSVAMAAVWHLLRTAGFAGPFTCCTACQAVLTSGMVILTGHFEPLCQDCARGRGVRFSAGAMKTVNRWLELPPAKFGGVETRGRLVGEMVRLLTLNLTAHLNRTPRALHFLGQLMETEVEEPR